MSLHFLDIEQERRMALTWTVSGRHKRVVVHNIFGCPDHSVLQTKYEVIILLHHIHSLFLQQCSLSWQNIPTGQPNIPNILTSQPYIANILTNHPTHAPLSNNNLQLNVQWDTELAWPQGQWFPHNLITLTSSPSCNELWYGARGSNHNFFASTFSRASKTTTF